MANAKNIEEHKFTSDNQPAAEKKSRKGVPNRATVFKKLLGIKVKAKNPAEGAELNITLYEKAALGQLLAAIDGNPTAWKEIQDTLHGKIVDKQEHSGPDGKPIEMNHEHKLIDNLLKNYGNDESTDRD